MKYIIPLDTNESQLVLIGATVDLFTYTVPAKARGVLKKFGNYIDTVAAWGDIVWSILKNGIPVFPYDAILDQIGQGYLPREISPIVFNGGDTLIVRVTNNHIANVQIGIALSGEIQEL